MKPRIYWAPPYVAALIMGALSFPGLASALTLEQALSVAEQDAPSLHAQAANLVAARSAAIPAGELPDPKLKLGLQSVPIEGDARWQLEQEAIRLDKTLLPLAEEKVRLAMADYRSGSGELTAVIEARRQLVETRLRRIDVARDRSLSNARLHFAFGDTRP